MTSVLPAPAGVSVIVPCYNDAAHIGETIASLLAQSLKPAEIIVVDDGSSDDSVLRVAAFGPAIRQLCQPNRGAAAARNAGVAAATQPLIAFLDGDDAWPETSLAVRHALLLQTGADLVFGAVRQCFGAAGPDAPSPGPAMAGRLAGSLLMTRALFDRVGPLDEGLKSAETIDWLSRAKACGMVEAQVPEVVLYRRIHGANMMLTMPDVNRNALAVLRRAVARRRAAS